MDELSYTSRKAKIVDLIASCQETSGKITSWKFDANSPLPLQQAAIAECEALREAKLDWLSCKASLAKLYKECQAAGMKEWRTNYNKEIVLTKKFEGTTPAMIPKLAKVFGVDLAAVLADKDPLI